jgi:hypothetical protein
MSEKYIQKAAREAATKLAEEIKTTHQGLTPEELALLGHKSDTRPSPTELGKVKGVKNKEQS